MAEGVSVRVRQVQHQADLKDLPQGHEARLVKLHAAGVLERRMSARRAQLSNARYVMYCAMRNKDNLYFLH